MENLLKFLWPLLGFLAVSAAAPTPCSGGMRTTASSAADATNMIQANSRILAIALNLLGSVVMILPLQHRERLCSALHLAIA
mmetsp:Transcript_109590/g.173108  ORF Transcript_109590/g.173108 Transcript_109590/m.173108 type:complete len:82 (-) Transcript_109590:151-396(-)